MTPWTLQYLRRRKRVTPFPTVFWPVAMPWGGLLSAMVMFLWITPGFVQIAGFPVVVAAASDTSARPLAVLRMHANRAATLHYFRADKLPDVRAAEVRRDIAALPPPPIPADLNRLGEDWILDEPDCHGCDLRAAFFGGIPPCCPIERRAPTYTRVLVARSYHPAIDGDGIRRALLEAKAAGIASDLVLVEADDETRTGAVIRAMDLCLTAGLRPELRMQ
jgi:hypothetical protein